MSGHQWPQTCNLQHEYSSYQLQRYLLNSKLNPGTRLQPVNVDSMMHVTSEIGLPDEIDPYISEVPGFTNEICWRLQENGKQNSDLIQDPKLRFVEIYSLAPGRDKSPDKDYWKQFFKLNDCSIVAPNGTLFQIPDSGNYKEISIKLKSERKSLLFGYGLVFSVKVGETQDLYYCRRDPVANIRSSDDDSDIVL